MSQVKTVKVCGHTLDFYKDNRTKHPEYKSNHQTEGMRYREKGERLQKGDIIYYYTGGSEPVYGIAGDLRDNHSCISVLCPKDAPYTFDSNIEVVRFQRGDRVKVLRASTKEEDRGGKWNNSWVDDMNKNIDKVFTVRSASNTGIRFHEVGFGYPWFCLEKVEVETTPNKVETKPKVVNRPQKTIINVVLQPNDRVRFDGVECRTAIDNYGTAYFIQKDWRFHKVFVSKAVLDSSLSGLFKAKVEYYNKKSKRWFRVAP
jgi:hypothetical protein